MKSFWILVADSSRARIFTADTPSSPLGELEDIAHTEGRLHDREITSDLPGRMRHVGGGVEGHPYNPSSDPKKHEASNFAHSIAQHLQEARGENKFEQLVIIAEPTFLGMLRNNLPEQVKKTVCLELDKSITTHSAAEIRAHLPMYLPSL
ncbi:host attachment protein [Methylobacter sp.]|uniref:host attachment protein n=1 Tax=Methylobacter sp. TaxID=2051955 RepID=UPI003DA2148E